MHRVEKFSVPDLCLGPFTFVGCPVAGIFKRIGPVRVSELPAGVFWGTGWGQGGGEGEGCGRHECFGRGWLDRRGGGVRGEQDDGLLGKRYFSQQCFQGEVILGRYWLVGAAGRHKEYDQTEEKISLKVKSHVYSVTVNSSKQHHRM